MSSDDSPPKKRSRVTGTGPEASSTSGDHVKLLLKALSVGDSGAADQLRDLFPSAAACGGQAAPLLTVAARGSLSQACQKVVSEEGLAKGVEVMVAASRLLGYLLSDPQSLPPRSLPVGLLLRSQWGRTQTVTLRFEYHPTRALRNNVDALKQRGIVHPGESELWWVFERWPEGRQQQQQGGVVRALESRWGGGNGVRCTLCSAVPASLPEARASVDPMQSTNPNELVVSVPLSDEEVEVVEGVESLLCHVNYAALAPHHFTAFVLEPTQQSVGCQTVGRCLSLLQKLGGGASCGSLPPFVVFHNGHATLYGGVMRSAGASLMHDHVQFMRCDLPLLNAPEVYQREVGGCGVTVSDVDWLSSVVKISAPFAHQLERPACKVIAEWIGRSPSDNTLNLVFTRREGVTIAFLVLRRVGLGSPGVASLEQCGVMVVEEEAEFQQLSSLSEAERMTAFAGKLQSCDPLWSCGVDSCPFTSMQQHSCHCQHFLHSHYHCHEQRKHLAIREIIDKVL